MSMITSSNANFNGKMAASSNARDSVSEMSVMTGIGEDGLGESAVKKSKKPLIVALIVLVVMLFCAIFCSKS